MDALECMRNRRSVRNYKPEPVSEDALKEILEAATQAPSAGNVQEWEFVVVRKQETKERLAEAALGQGFIAEAPVVIVVCANLARISSAYGTRGETLYSIQDTAAAAINLMNAAWSRGLGTCWVGAFSEQGVKEALVLPENVRPMAIIPVGHPAETRDKPRRRPVEEVVHEETF